MRYMTLAVNAKGQVVQQLHEHFKGHVLDVGCGAMPFKRLFRGDEGFRPDCEVTDWTGLDVRAVGDVQADAHDMPFEDGQFDTVLCTDLLQYVPDPPRVVLECARVLKQGGCAVFVTRFAFPDEDAWYGITTSGLASMIRLAGMEVLEVGAAGNLVGAKYDAFRHEHKYRLAVPTPVQGFVDGLGESLPMVVFGVGKKTE